MAYKQLLKHQHSCTRHTAQLFIRITITDHDTNLMKHAITAALTQGDKDKCLSHFLVLNLRLLNV